MNETFCILIRVSLKFVPKGPIDIKAAMVQVMVWRRIGDTPLTEAMLTPPTDAYMQHWGGGVVKLTLSFQGKNIEMVGSNVMLW